MSSTQTEFAIALSQKCYNAIKAEWETKGRMIRGKKTLRITFTGDTYTTSITFENGVLYGTDPFKGKRRIEAIDDYYKNDQLKHKSVKGAFTAFLIQKGMDVDLAMKYGVEFSSLLEVVEARRDADEASEMLAPLIQELLTRHSLA
jgi:hypothetical protein